MSRFHSTSFPSQKAASWEKPFLASESLNPSLSLILFLFCIPTVTTLVYIEITSDTVGKEFVTGAAKTKPTNKNFEKVLKWMTTVEQLKQ